jgi:hypothetical protein
MNESKLIDVRFTFQVIGGPVTGYLSATGNMHFSIEEAVTELDNLQSQSPAPANRPYCILQGTTIRGKSTFAVVYNHD